VTGLDDLEPMGSKFRNLFDSQQGDGKDCQDAHTHTLPMPRANSHSHKQKEQVYIGTILLWAGAPERACSMDNDATISATIRDWCSYGATSGSHCGQHPQTSKISRDW
jgi:hypothetical protein